MHRSQYISVMLLSSWSIFVCSDCGVVCKEGEFLCPGRRCVLYLHRCDGHNDCGDFSDERGWLSILSETFASIKTLFYVWDASDGVWCASLDCVELWDVVIVCVVFDFTDVCVHLESFSARGVTVSQHTESVTDTETVPLEQMKLFVLVKVHECKPHD